MKRTPRLAVLALIVLMAAPVASAKEISALQVCGASGCIDVELPSSLHESTSMTGGSPSPPPAGPFVEVAVAFGGAHAERLWYVPASRTFAFSIEGSAIWSNESGSERIDRLVAAAAAEIEPYRPRVVAAFVGDDRVTGDVTGYMDLFEFASKGTARIGAGRFLPVSIETEPPSPWARTALWFYPDQGLLQRGLELIRLPDDVVDDLRAARSVGTARGTGFDWSLVTGSLVVAFARARTPPLFARRSRPPRPGTV